MRIRRITRILVLSALAGCGGAETQPQAICADEGRACGPSVSCCDHALSCLDGVCAAQRRCSDTGGACSATAPCCGADDRCVSGRCLTRTGARCGKGADCQSGSCWIYAGADGSMCTQSCLSSSSCGSLVAGLGCYSVNGGGAVCLKTCSASAECAALGPDWSCSNARLVEGSFQGVCSLWRNQEIGAPCHDNAQCAAPALCASAWCTQSCTSNGQCGGSAACVANSKGVQVCFPVCSTDADCAIFDAQTRCVAARRIDGTATQVCSF